MAAIINQNLVNDVLAIIESLGFENFAEYAKSQGDAEWTAMGLWEADGMAIAYAYEWEELEAVVNHLWVG
jgi:hypothetical protein